MGAAAGPCGAYSMGRRDVRAAGGRRPSRSWSPRAPGSNGVQGGAVARRVLLDGEVVARMCDCLGTASTTTARAGLEPPTGGSVVRGWPINDWTERSAGCPGGAPRAGGWRTEPLDQVSLIQIRKKSVRTQTRTRTPSVKVPRRGASFLRGSSDLLRVAGTITGIPSTDTSTILY